MSGFGIEDHAPWPLGRFDGLSADQMVSHGVTTRDGPEFGVDGTAAATGDAAGALADTLGLAGAAWVHQVHGGLILHARTPGRAGRADGLISATPGLLLVGRSADCPLVLLAGRRGDGSPAVGFAHASWRATVAGVTANLMVALRDELDVSPETVRASIAPSAGPCCYEVQDDVRNALLAAHGPAVAAYFTPHDDRWLLDLWAANRAQLLAAGVAADHIETSGVCTICRGQRFWSWRVQREQAGRFAAAIGVRATLHAP